MTVSRRQVLAGGAALSAMSLLKLGFTNRALALDGFGPLVPTPSVNTGEVLLDLPSGFSYKVFGRTGEIMRDLAGAEQGPTPGEHDGMAGGAAGRGQVFKLTPQASGRDTLELFIEAPARADSGPASTWAGPDTVAPWGDLVLCETGAATSFSGSSRKTAGSSGSRGTRSAGGTSPARASRRTAARFS
jgi:hypothetical protein